MNTPKESAFVDNLLRALTHRSINWPKGVLVSKDFDAGSIVEPISKEGHWEYYHINCLTIHNVDDFKKEMSIVCQPKENLDQKRLILIEHLTEAVDPQILPTLHDILVQRRKTEQLFSDIVITYTEDTKEEESLVNQCLLGEAIFFQSVVWKG